ncbi:NAD-dependent epimerase/dehydratase family protein [Halomonas salina]|uniref:NAD-dependent epimerase/dehydratase family protein n=1 Tax=Halomonas salina TaxID=42565 RepID=UPI0022860EB1|nr:NAD-dependent epimerase/dehydratase family protein [Halomonas salina]
MEFTLLLASLAKSSGVRRFVFLSSIGVNGNQSMEAIGVESEASPKGEYARSKYDAEKGLQDIASGAEFDVVIVRPPLVYGPDAPGSFGLLTKVVAKPVPLPLSGINNQRSFISVWNLVSLIVTCLDHPKASNQVFVVSDGEDVSTSELLVKIGEASGCPVKLFWMPKALLKAGAILLRKRELYDKLFNSLKVDDGHARNTLGWTPPLTLDEGLRRCFTD